MPYIRTFLLILLIILCVHPLAIAQEPQGRISGKILNPEKEPSEYSTVVLMNRDSVFMAGTLSGPDGSFLFDG